MSTTDRKPEKAAAAPAATPERDDAADPRATGRPAPEPGVTSPEGLDAAAQPDADVVAMVSRDVNGDPAQSAKYAVLVDDDAPDHVKDAAHNLAGEAVGAKHVDANPDHTLPEIDDDERAARERDELAAINRGPAR